MKTRPQDDDDDDDDDMKNNEEFIHLTQSDHMNLLLAVAKFIHAAWKTPSNTYIEC